MHTAFIILLNGNFKPKYLFINKSLIEMAVANPLYFSLSASNGIPLGPAFVGVCVPRAPPRSRRLPSHPVNYYFLTKYMEKTKKN